MIKLDGSTLEGGGQLTRMALCLSAITGQKIKIHSIRAGRGARSTPNLNHTSKRSKGPSRNEKALTQQTSLARLPVPGGLKESHLAALEWLAAQTHANVDGAEVGSTEVSFNPGKLRGMFGPGIRQRGRSGADGGGGTIVDTIRLKNPGSIWLIFQAIYPFMVFGSRGMEHDAASPAPSTTAPLDVSRPVDDQSRDRVLFDLTLIGGTNVPKSMSTEYVQQVFLPVCEKIGLPRVELETVRSGWTTGMLEVGEVRVRMYAPTSTSTNLGPLSQADHDGFRLPAFSLIDRGDITNISITIVSTPHLFPTLTDLLTTTIASHPTFTALESQPGIDVHATTDSGHERRLYILLVAHTSTGLRIGRDMLGNGGRPKNARDEETMLLMTARTVVDGLMREIEGGGCVDEFMQDQIVAFQALADGLSEVRGSDGLEHAHGQSHGQECDESDDRGGTLHTRTVRWVCEQIVPGVKFRAGGICRAGGSIC